MSSPIIKFDGHNNTSSHDLMTKAPSSIEVYGSKNKLDLHKQANLSRFAIKIQGDNNSIEIEENTEMRGLVYIRGDSCRLIIGKNSTSAGVRFTIGAERTIKLGADCMLSRNIEIRCWDEHPLYDLDSRKQINPGQDVTIGDHVWFSEGVVVNKGVSIASGSVIGAGAVVTRNLLIPNSVYAGIPASLIRERVAWARSPKEMNWSTADYRVG